MAHIVFENEFCMAFFAATNCCLNRAKTGRARRFALLITPNKFVFSKLKGYPDYRRIYMSTAIMMNTKLSVVVLRSELDDVLVGMT